MGFSRKSAKPSAKDAAKRPTKSPEPQSNEWVRGSARTSAKGAANGFFDNDLGIGSDFRGSKTGRKACGTGLLASGIVVGNGVDSSGVIGILGRRRPPIAGLPPKFPINFSIPMVIPAVFPMAERQAGQGAEAVSAG